MMDLARDIPMFPRHHRTLRAAASPMPCSWWSSPAKTSEEEQLVKLQQLDELMGDMGFPNAVVKATTGCRFQSAEFWEVRKSGLNIMMSMKGDGKPISFIEDCAVPLEDLAEYTDRLTRVFEKYGTKGTWYAHASVGCLHVRPIVNLKQEDGASENARHRRGSTSKWCASTRAPIPANMATAWSGPSFTKRCSARA